MHSQHIFPPHEAGQDIIIDANNSNQFWANMTSLHSMQFSKLCTEPHMSSIYFRTAFWVVMITDLCTIYNHTFECDVTYSTNFCSLDIPDRLVIGSVMGSGPHSTQTSHPGLCQGYIMGKRQELEPWTYPNWGGGGGGGCSPTELS